MAKLPESEPAGVCSASLILRARGLARGLPQASAQQLLRQADRLERLSLAIRRLRRETGYGWK